MLAFSDFLLLSASLMHLLHMDSVCVFMTILFHMSGATLFRAFLAVSLCLSCPGRQQCSLASSSYELHGSKEFTNAANSLSAEASKNCFVTRRSFVFVAANTKCLCFCLLFFKN